AGIDSRWQPNAGGDINVKQGKVNMFAGANIRTRKSISEGATERSTFFKDPVTDLKQDDYNLNKGNFMFGRAGLDYFMNPRNTIGFSVNAVRGKFSFDNSSKIQTDTLYPSATTTGFSRRISDG